MTGKEVLSKAANCTMDELTAMISQFRAQADMMEEVFRIRVKDGEKTTEMIKRAEAKAKREQEQKEEQKAAEKKK